MKRILCIGAATMDMVYRVAEMPTRWEKYRAQDLHITGGGSAANAAVAMTRLGAHVTLFARVGADRAGRDIVEGLEREGVDTSGVYRAEGCTSSISAVFVDAIGERVVVSHSDPHLPKSTDWLPRSLPEGTDAVLGDMRWPEGTEHLFRLARAAGIPAVLDGDRACLSAPEILRLATHAAFSMQGLRDITGRTEARLALEIMRPEGATWLAVTNGGEGMFHWQDGRVEHMPAFPVPVVDTLGAGDTWHGAFTVRLAEGASEWEAARFACAAGALKCTRFGGREGAPRREEVEEFLRRMGAA